MPRRRSAHQSESRRRIQIHVMALAVLELCEALSCSNVDSEVVELVDQRKNAKRIKQGKLPMYETRRLVIKAPITRGAASQAQGDSLWLASEGFGLLQQALLAAQEVGRPASRKGQSVLRGPKGRRAETPEDVSSARMQCEASRERVLHETCAAGEARDYRNGTTEQERSGKGWVGETPFAVRRLIVEECEFLQGFPRGYSKIPWRNKPANECPDGPRYRALGNSWAVPCVTWLGQRIAASLE